MAAGPKCLAGAFRELEIRSDTKLQDARPAGAQVACGESEDAARHWTHLTLAVRVLRPYCRYFEHLWRQGVSELVSHLDAEHPEDRSSAPKVLQPRAAQPSPAQPSPA